MGAIRFFLALVVAFDHLFFFLLQPNGWVPYMGWRFGLNAGYAVMFFYMISGFLISSALNTKYCQAPDALIRFYQRRFVRIFSLYWPLLIVGFLLFPSAQDWMKSASITDHLTGLLLFGIDWRVSFASYPVPYTGAAVPHMGQAWTLGVELTFYLLAPWLLRSWKLSLGTLLASAAFRAAVAIYGGFQPIWSYTFLPGLLVFFLLGHFARWTAEIVPALRLGWIGFTLLAISAMISAATPLRAVDSPAFWIVSILFASALPGVFAATKDRPIMNILGELSYPTYLIHLFVIAFIRPYAVALAPLLPFPGEIVTVLYLPIVVIGAVIAHLALERPVGGFMKAAFGRFPLRSTLSPAE